MEVSLFRGAILMSSTQEKLVDIINGFIENENLVESSWCDEHKDGLHGRLEVGQQHYIIRQLTQLIDSAKREGFLEGQLESLGKVTKENFMYRCLYGELLLDYKGVDLLEAYKSYRENDSFRENFARYVEWVAVELKQSEESK